MGDATSLPDRFWTKVDKNGPVPDYRPDLGPCWLWLAGRISGGYSKFVIDQRQVLGHRVVYEDAVGPIPDGFHVDHLCRIRHCVNPDHLEPVTPYENFIRGQSPVRRNIDKTHCKQGHPYNEENTYYGPDGRKCRPCERAGKARRLAAFRSLVPKKHRNSMKAECIRGHAFTPENTHITPRGTRQCRKCRGEYKRKAPRVGDLT